MINGIIFDLDNTLYSYDACDKVAYSALKAYSVDKFQITEYQFDELFVQAKKITKAKLGDVAASHNRLLYMQKFIELLHRNPFDYATEMYNLYWNTFLKKMNLYDFVIPLLRYLKEKNVKVGILTDLTAFIQYRKINTLGLNNLIDCFVTSEEAGREKPSEVMFLLMLEKMKLDPGDVVMVGDSVDKDIRGAEKSGINGILLTDDLKYDYQLLLWKKYI